MSLQKGQRLRLGVCVTRNNSQIALVEGFPGDSSVTATGHTNHNSPHRILALGLSCCHLCELDDFLACPICSQYVLAMEISFFLSLSSHLKYTSFDQGYIMVPSPDYGPQSSPEGHQENQFLASTLLKWAS